MLWKKFKKLIGVLGLIFIFICHLTQQITNLPVSCPGDRVKLISSLEQFIPLFFILIGIYPAFLVLVFTDQAVPGIMNPVISISESSSVFSQLVDPLFSCMNPVISKSDSPSMFIDALFSSIVCGVHDKMGYIYILIKS